MEGHARGYRSWTCFFLHFFDKGFKKKTAVLKKVFFLKLWKVWFVCANCADHDPPKILKFSLLPQVHASAAWVLSCIQCVGGRWVGWDIYMQLCKMSLALAYRLDATLSGVSCTCLPTWCYVLRCLQLPTALMLRCEMSLALAYPLDATLWGVSCTCLPTWCWLGVVSVEVSIFDLMEQDVSSTWI